MCVYLPLLPRRPVSLALPSLTSLLPLRFSSGYAYASPAAPPRSVRAQSLMNSAWDTPADPYVDSRKFPAAIAAFLVRANVAVEHPSDARRLRLVLFQRGAGETQ